MKNNMMGFVKFKILTLNIFIIIFISSCIFSNGKIEIDQKKFRPTLNINITKIQVINHQFVITGTGLNKILDFKIKNGGSIISLDIESKSDTSLIANTLANVSLAVGGSTEFIFSNNVVEASFQITFVNTNNSITAPMLNSMSATEGHVMKYNGANWIASTVPSTLNYLGVWDAGANDPNLSTPSAIEGDYYIVTAGGVFNTVTYDIGDWIISNGSTWQKIPYSSNAVETFNSRKGIVTPVPGDYVLLKNGLGKLPGSTLNDLVDVEIATPVNGSVLKYDSASAKWIVGTDERGEGAFAGVANRAVITSGAGALTTSAVTATELNYVSGVTSSIQAQLNSKLPSILNDGKIFVGNGSGVATSVSMAGDATLTNVGVLSLKNVATPGTYTSVTTDSQGRVVAGTNPAVAAITALTGDVTATGPGPTAATIAASAVTSAKILDASILPSDLDFTGTNIGTSGLVIRNSTGGFSPLVCATAGHVPTWTISGFICQAGGSGTVSGTAGKIAKFTASIVVGDSLMSESSSAITLDGILALPATTSTTGYLSINGSRFMHALGGTYLGTLAGNLTNTGTSNVGVGTLSLFNITSGDYNVAVGSEAGFYTEAGSQNTYVGVGAGSQNINGTNNTSIGRSAGSGAGTGSFNTYIGTNTGLFWVDSENTLVGDQAGGNTSLYGGTKSTYMGYRAGSVSTSAQNIFIGYEAGVSVTSGFNNVIIGGNNGASIATGANNILLADGQGNEYIRVNSSGNVGIGTTTPGYKLQVGNSGDGSAAGANAWVTLSDERLKKDFEVIPDALDKILSVKGYYYYWKDGADSTKHMGVKAQEVEKIFPEIVSRGADGFLSVSYNHLVAGVIEAIKSFYDKWVSRSALLHEKIRFNDTKLVESKRKLQLKMADEEIEALRIETSLIKKYLCAKDKKAVFCE